MKILRLLAAVCACAITLVSMSADAVPVSGQGTWETTLQGRLETAPGSGVFLAYYDTVLDITWAADANINGRINWSTANAWAAGLTLGGVSGWRLPTVSPIDGSTFDTTFSNNATTDYGTAPTTTDGTDGGWRDITNTPVSELGHMFYVNLGNLGICTPDDADPSICVVQGGYGLTNTGPFSRLSGTYWSGTESDSDSAWYFGFGNGRQEFFPKAVELFDAWAVRSGDVGGVEQSVLADAVDKAKKVLDGPYTSCAKAWDFSKNEGPFLTDLQVITGDTYTTGCGYTGQGLDCSGLVLWAYNSSYDPLQFKSVVHYANADGQFRYNTRALQATETLSPGDLMFFDWGSWDGAKYDCVKDNDIDHVAMYVGDYTYIGDNKSYDLVEAASETLGIIPNTAAYYEGYRIDSDDPTCTPGFVGHYRRLISAALGFQVKLNSPIDVVVTDPEGVVITRDTLIESDREVRREVPGELYYSIYDVHTDGTPMTEVFSPKFKQGNYFIRPIRREDAPPGSTYDITVVTSGGAIGLAADVSVDDIPLSGYGVTVANNSLTPFVPANLPAVANAGSDQVLECTGTDGAQVTLDASASVDLDNDPLTYTWTGPFEELTGSNVTTTIPFGTHTITLLVDDSEGGADSDTVEITVQGTYCNPLDSDNDGAPDVLDNCVEISNTHQRDTDGDGYGNMCDPDFDNNLTVNAADLAYLKATFFSSDQDADLDGNGVVNAADLAILKIMFFGPPGPSGLVP